MLLPRLTCRLGPSSCSWCCSPRSHSPPLPAAVQDEEPQGVGLDQWSEAYRNHIFPWAPAGDLKAQFKEYSEHSDVVTRMQMLAEDHSGIFEFHEGLNGGQRRDDHHRRHLRGLVPRLWLTLDEGHRGRERRGCQPIQWGQWELRIARTSTSSAIITHVNGCPCTFR